MLIVYCVTAAFGEPWNQSWSFVQLFGMFVLLYGTAIYNAPNPGIPCSVARKAAQQPPQQPGFEQRDEH